MHGKMQDVLKLHLGHYGGIVFTKKETTGIGEMLYEALSEDEGMILCSIRWETCAYYLTRA